jgi:hypothetical protein
MHRVAIGQLDRNNPQVSLSPDIRVVLISGKESGCASLIKLTVALRVRSAGTGRLVAWKFS